MSILSTIYRTILAIVWLTPVGLMAADNLPPVKGAIDLSSNFCEFRPLHFHGGIDIRTGGEIGREVFSPADGYVWRIKYAYGGYGKGLYIKDHEGNIYVFGHLSRLNQRLESIVFDIHQEEQSYCFDRHFKNGEIPVEQGELIAYTGQTGYGAPHLHYEKRTPDNKPTNPLIDGVDIYDDYHPEFNSVGFIYTDSARLFDNGQRRLFSEARYRNSDSSYYLDNILFVRAPFGIMIDADDRIRRNGRLLNLYKIKLYIDDYLYYEVAYDQYDYSQTDMVDLSFDYYNIVNSNKYWHLLYNPVGKEYTGAKAHFSSGGIFEPATEQNYGLHDGRIEVYDAAGNRSVLNFEFFYYPLTQLFRPFMMADTLLQLSRRKNIDLVKVDNVEVYMTDNKGWRKLPAGRLIAKRKGDYELNLAGLNPENQLLRFELIGAAGWRTTDQYYSFYLREIPEYRLEYELLDGGLFVKAKATRRNAPVPIIEIEYEDGYRFRDRMNRHSSNRYSFFYRNEEIRTLIKRLILIDETTDQILVEKGVTIAIGGIHPDRQRLKLPDGFYISFDDDNFYRPTYLEIIKEKRKFEFPRNIRSNVYTTEPKTIPLAKAVEVSYQLDESIDKSKIGICRLNKKKEWNWLDSKIIGDRITTKSSLMGTFAVLADNAPPKIRKIFPPNGKTVFKSRPKISCQVIDGLSNLDDCGDIEVTIDGRLQIPEYDPETHRLQFYPDRPLQKGKHDLMIRAVDRVGNEKIVRTHFFVNDKKKN